MPLITPPQGLPVPVRTEAKIFLLALRVLHEWLPGNPFFSSQLLPLPQSRSGRHHGALPTPRMFPNPTYLRPLRSAWNPFLLRAPDFGLHTKGHRIDEDFPDNAI